MTNELLNAYRYHRQAFAYYEGRPPAPRRSERGAYRYKRPKTALEALSAARADVADHVTRYPRTQGFPAMGTAGERGGRYADSIADAGLHFVGWADEIGGRSIDHKGWYTHPDGDPDDVNRGAVLQLPGKSGRIRYIPAYQTGTTGRDGQWSTTDSGFFCFLGDMVTGEADESDAYSSNRGQDDAARDAARSADQEARISAEKEREYNEAWQAGSLYAALGDELPEIISAFRALYRESKALTPGSAVMAAARAKLVSLAEEWAETRAKRAALIDGDSTSYGYRGREHWAAFCDGAEIDPRQPVWIVKGETTGLEDDQPAGIVEFQFSDGPPGNRGASSDYTDLLQGLKDHAGDLLNLSAADFTPAEQAIFDAFKAESGA